MAIMKQPNGLQNTVTSEVDSGKQADFGSEWGEREISGLDKWPARHFISISAFAPSSRSVTSFWLSYGVCRSMNLGNHRLRDDPSRQAEAQTDRGSGQDWPPSTR
jgi:hypothetical protein